MVRALRYAQGPSSAAYQGFGATGAARAQCVHLRGAAVKLAAVAHRQLTGCLLRGECTPPPLGETPLAGTRHRREPRLEPRSPSPNTEAGAPTGPRRLKTQMPVNTRYNTSRRRSGSSSNALGSCTRDPHTQAPF